MKIGFIGAGNMATAIVNGIVNKKFVLPEDIFISDKDSTKLKIQADRNINTTSDNTEVVLKSDIIVLAVKPNILSGVCDEIKPFLKSKTALSIAAGVNTDTLIKLLDTENVVRVMPNTPAMVGEGMTAICDNTGVDAKTFTVIKEMFETLGKVVTINEKLIDGVTAVSGSGPAYIYMIIEAMADGGVKCGLPRDVATTLAAQTVLGSAKMVLDTGKHPGQLKDMVCSPGGTTIEAVYSLEQSGVRGAFMEAVDKCFRKSMSM